MVSIFDFRDYRGYLVETLGGENKRTGKRGALAAHLGCQSAFVSQVLKGVANFSLEQALRINSFLGHDRTQSNYFMLLVSLARAGSRDLEIFFERQIESMLAERQVVKNRLEGARDLTLEERAIYYSSWVYAAIHVAVSIPELQQPQALAAHFSISTERAQQTLNYLVGVGLVTIDGDRYSVGRVHIHLGHDSDAIAKHHSNWRIEAMKSLDQESERDLHYSVVYSLSRTDALKLREKMLQLISDNLKAVGPSKEEVVYCHTMDFFEV